ncbi:hypothetical protein PILCRDRAFT_310355 [Piloderma croceum F 1598]|uniref:Uncharacterized protein n=1 Tax=Piloderma croceum (strain F 1598) TaxID=765440 RepID=A0A0C3BJW4_PILCF|nr:hypothetical protein PILCRDRAFT_310355 [Piloderma croceum F 1598]
MSMLTVPTRQKSGKSEQRQRHLQDLSNVVSQNQSLDNVRIHGQLDKELNKSTGFVALLIDEMNRTTSQDDSTRTCLLSLDIICNDSYDMNNNSFFDGKLQVDVNDLSKHEPASVDKDIPVLHTGESCSKNLGAAFFPSTPTFKATTTFEAGSFSIDPATASALCPQSQTSVISPDASMDDSTDTSADTGFAHAISKSDACFEKGFTTPPPKAYVEEVRNLVAEQLKGKASRNVLHFAAVSRFFKGSFHRDRNRSATLSKSKTTRAVRPSSSSSSAPLVPKSPSFNVNTAFPEYASFSPYPSWLVPGSGAFSR